ncbi:hypothetical protein ACFLX5_05635 [Chloroflexota bacterium]
MDRAEFQSQLADLREIIVEGIACFASWRSLMVEDQESAAALNRYRVLFLCAREALHKTALLQLSKVFDRDPRTTSLRTLLSAAKADRGNLVPHTTEEGLQDVERRLDANEDLLNRLKCYRDQRLAHNDAIHASEGMSFRFSEVRDLIEEVKSMYNLLEEGQVSFEQLARLAKFHTDEVVRIMREDRERAIRTIEKADTAT